MAITEDQLKILNSLFRSSNGRPTSSQYADCRKATGLKQASISAWFTRKRKFEAKNREKDAVNLKAEPDVDILPPKKKQKIASKSLREVKKEPPEATLPSPPPSSPHISNSKENIPADYSTLPETLDHSLDKDGFEEIVESNASPSTFGSLNPNTLGRLANVLLLLSASQDDPYPPIQLDQRVLLSQHLHPQQRPLHPRTSQYHVIRNAYPAASAFDYGNSSQQPTPFYASNSFAAPASSRSHYIPHSGDVNVPSMLFQQAVTPYFDRVPSAMETVPRALQTMDNHSSFMPTLTDNRFVPGSMHDGISCYRNTYGSQKKQTDLQTYYNINSRNPLLFNNTNDSYAEPQINHQNHQQNFCSNPNKSPGAAQLLQHLHVLRPLLDNTVNNNNSSSSSSSSSVPSSYTQNLNANGSFDIDAQEQIETLLSMPGGAEQIVDRLCDPKLLEEDGFQAAMGVLWMEKVGLISNQ